MVVAAGVVWCCCGGGSVVVMWWCGMAWRVCVKIWTELKTVCVLDTDIQPPHIPGMDPGVHHCHGMKVNPTGVLWSKHECFLIRGCQDMDLKKTLTQKYQILKRN